MKNGSSIIILLLLTTMVATCSYFAFFDKSDNVDDNSWPETHATLWGYTLGRGARNIVKYKVGLKEYTYDGSFGFYGKTIGERYIIRYNPEDPEQVKEYTWRLVFLEDELTKDTTGKVERVFWYGPGRHALRYSYIVNGKVIEKEQDLPRDDTYKKISKGQHYRVQYWALNPQRAILYLNEIKE